MASYSRFRPPAPPDTVQLRKSRVSLGRSQFADHDGLILDWGDGEMHQLPPAIPSGNEGVNPGGSVLPISTSRFYLRDVKNIKIGFHACEEASKSL